MGIMLGRCPPDFKLLYNRKKRRDGALSHNHDVGTTVLGWPHLNLTPVTLFHDLHYARLPD